MLPVCNSFPSSQYGIPQHINLTYISLMDNNTFSCVWGPVFKYFSLKIFFNYFTLSSKSYVPFLLIFDDQELPYVCARPVRYVCYQVFQFFAYFLIFWILTLEWAVTLKALSSNYVYFHSHGWYVCALTKCYLPHLLQLFFFI